MKSDLQTTYKRGTIGIVRTGNDNAKARLLHDSPPDQEAVSVELLEDFICLECGEIAEFQRYEFLVDSEDRQ